MEFQTLLKDNNIESKASADFILHEIKHPTKTVEVEEYPKVVRRGEHYFKLYIDSRLIYATYGADVMLEAVLMEFE